MRRLHSSCGFGLVMGNFIGSLDFGPPSTTYRQPLWIQSPHVILYRKLVNVAIMQRANGRMMRLVWWNNQSIIVLSKQHSTALAIAQIALRLLYAQKNDRQWRSDQSSKEILQFPTLAVAMHRHSSDRPTDPCYDTLFSQKRMIMMRNG